MNKRLFITGILGIVLSASCHQNRSGNEKEHTGAPDDTEQTENHSDEIIYSKEKASASGIETETVERTDFCGILATSGKIRAASDDETTLVAGISGEVHFKENITEGSKVKKGNVLFVLSANHIQDGDPAERASAAYETARKEYERAEKLVKDKIISEKEFNAIKGTYEEARIAYEATARNRYAGGTAVKSPTDGYVKSCMVSEGEYVTAGQPMMSIVRNNKLYLRADIAERHYPALNNIRCAKFKTAYSDSIYDTRKMNGRLLAIGKTTAESSAYIPVTFEIENPGSLVAGSFAEIYLQTNDTTPAISLPLSAITEEQGVKFVYVQEDEDCYRKQEVRLGMSNGERTEILSGLNIGDKVVTKGAVRIKIAAASGAIPAHTHNH